MVSQQLGQHTARAATGGDQRPTQEQFTLEPVTRKTLQPLLKASQQRRKGFGFSTPGRSLDASVARLFEADKHIRENQHPNAHSSQIAQDTENR
jgi:hypothetical protein